MSAASLVAASQWYAATACLSVVVWPLACKLLPGSQDRGWGFARIVSPHLVIYVAWLLASIKLLPWGVLPLATATLVISLASGAVLVTGKSGALVRRRLKPRAVLGTELVFAIFFIATILIRSQKPEIIGLEKFMNWAFINAALHSPTLPPPDPWLAGYPINYYYFGHFVAAGLIVFSGVDTAVGYNLMLCQVVATSGVAVFMIIRRLLISFGHAAARYGWGLGVAGAVLTLFGGNFHAVLYGIVRPLLVASHVFGLAADNYRFPMSTRFIGHHPATSDKTITEFPSYGIFTGELHAHVLNLPIDLAMLFLCLTIVIARVSVWQGLLGTAGLQRKTTIFGHAIVYGILLGIASIGNTWDFPIYLLAFGFCLFAAECQQLTRPIRAAVLAVVGVTAEVLIALALTIPFWRSFHPFTHGITRPQYGSPLWQLAVLYGNYAFVGVSAGLFLPRLLSEATPRARRALLATAILFLLSIVLLAIPESISIRDIYGIEYLRANTMFKMSFQAYVMLAVASVLGAAMLVSIQTNTRNRVFWALGLTVLLLPQLSYGWFVYDQFLRPPAGQLLTLDGGRFLSENKMRDWNIVAYLNGHRPAAGEAILEASGESYTETSRISAATGIPTVLGWYGHEWLWRGTFVIEQERADQITKFYNSSDYLWRRNFIRQYKIRYIVVGLVEQRRYEKLDRVSLGQLGTVVSGSLDDVFLLEVNPFENERQRSSEQATGEQRD
jgi:uncharacterized membrane protein